MQVAENGAQFTDASIVRVEHARECRHDDDYVAVEEPLEIQLWTGSGEYSSLSVTMRTPGNDRELVAGFLFNEGVIERRDQILAFEHWGPLNGDEKVRNIVRVRLDAPAANTGRLERHFFASSSCGLCGKATLGAVRSRRHSVGDGRARITADLVRALPAQLATHQGGFSQTGGLHATAVFDLRGRLCHIFEDVGRHNAMDKAAGALLVEDRMPANASITLVSGRIGFELVQKAVRMGCPILCAIGAPSSLAIELAAASSMTLIGFVRDKRFNIYSGADRVVVR